MTPKELERVKFEKYIKAQSKYISDCKYFEGINTHKDPGQPFVLNWVNEHANEFRLKWNVSSCKDCVKADQCGDKLRPYCPDKQEYPKD